MNIREITSGIFYTGVNDRVTDRFEGMWPLPDGVSYNSYIVKGTEKTVLVDTVEIGTFPEYLLALKEVNGESGNRLSCDQPHGTRSFRQHSSGA